MTINANILDPEIWGYGNFDDLERVQLKFFKYTFYLKISTPSYMIYGELGITPLHVDINSRAISYWARLLENIEDDQTTKLASKLYLVSHELYNQRLLKSNWFDNIKQILCNSGYSGIWYSQSFINSS